MIPFVVLDYPAITGINWLWLLGAGFFPGFLGILFAVFALKKLPATTFGTLAYFEPIFVAILGWGIFGERLNTLQSAGCLFMILGGAAKGYLTATQRDIDRAQLSTTTAPTIPR